MWISKKFKCKGTMKTCPSMDPSYTWLEEFIEGKWYDCYYETSGWYEYKAISEIGKEVKFSKAEFNIVFFVDHDEIRDQLIDEIIN